MSLCATCGAELKPEWKFCIACGTPVPPPAEPEAPVAPGFNMLAILAFLLACIGGAPALIFGHYAVSQIKQSGERGIVLARIATVLGYVWLAVWIIAITLWLTGAWR